MYNLLTIGGKEYKLEYTMEAALYDEGIEKLVSFMEKAFGGMDADENADMSDEEAAERQERAMKKGIAGISNIPAVTLSVFYAGLLEHHGTGKNGDRSIRSKEDAKDVLRTYLEEHEEDGTGNFYDLLMICVNQMGEDGFFKRIGLEKMMGIAESQTASLNRAQRRAKKKVTETQ